MFGAAEFPAIVWLKEEKLGEIANAFWRFGKDDVGWILYDLDFEKGRLPIFFRPVISDGVMAVPRAKDAALVR
ncbi:hypothetical protein [Allosphingosinicella indica]|uniref:hypothetical protein n=1 Tax=Allosphingosinicella indica TaxID=941907 RepID=UPI0018D3C365|nr:hypothetical protein [Allosphingosinicella indica]